MPRIAAASACYRMLILYGLRGPRRFHVGVVEEGQVLAVDIVHPRVAGIDVHKKVIWVAVRVPGGEPGERRVLVKSFADLLAAAAADGGLAG